MNRLTTAVVVAFVMGVVVVSAQADRPSRRVDQARVPAPIVGELRGRLVGHTSAVPLADAYILLCKPTESQLALFQSASESKCSLSKALVARTDADGRFVLGSVPVGQYLVVLGLTGSPVRAATGGPDQWDMLEISTGKEIRIFNTPEILGGQFTDAPAQSGVQVGLQGLIGSTGKERVLLVIGTRILAATQFGLRMEIRNADYIRVSVFPGKAKANEVALDAYEQ